MSTKKLNYQAKNQTSTKIGAMKILDTDTQDEECLPAFEEELLVNDSQEEEKNDGYRRINSLAGFLEGDHLAATPKPPISVFCKELQDVIEETAKGKCIPTSISLFCLLALGSACINRARGVKYKRNWKERANLYMILAAESGSGKSHAFKYMFDALSKHQAMKKKQFKQLNKQYTEDMLAYRKSKDSDKKIPEKPLNVQYLLNDSTMEAASERLEDNPKGLFWALDEMSGFFASLDKYNKSGGDGKRRILSAFNAEEWNTSRKSKDGEVQERYLEEGCLGIFGGIQPFLLNNLFSYEDVKQGLPQRFLYVNAPIKKPIQLPLPEIPECIDKILERITTRLINLEMPIDNFGNFQTKYIHLDENAELVFEHFVNAINDRSFDTDAYAYAVKMGQITLRLAVIIKFLNWACSENDEKEPETIDYDAMTNATILANWFCYHTEQVRLHFPTSEASDIQKLQRMEKKKTLLEELHEFIDKNQDYCSQPHTATEILQKIGKKSLGAVAFGRFLNSHGFEGQGRITQYTLYHA